MHEYSIQSFKMGEKGRYVDSLGFNSFSETRRMIIRSAQVANKLQHETNTETNQRKNLMM